MRVIECVAEEPKRSLAHEGPALPPIWHITAGDDPDASFQPILCGGGIAFRGYLEDREPNCPDCISSAGWEARGKEEG